MKKLLVLSVLAASIGLVSLVDAAKPEKKINPHAQERMQQRKKVRDERAAQQRGQVISLDDYQDTQVQSGQVNPFADYLSEHPDLFPIDQIMVIIFGEEDIDIIVYSDTQRLGLDGSPRGLDQIILERLLYQDAKRFKITPSPEMLDKYLQSVQRENNLSQDQLKAIFKNAGYTFEEGREQFAVMYATNSVIDFKIKSRLVVPEREVRVFYTEHPEIEKGAVNIQRGAAPMEDYQSAEQIMEAILWGSPFWMDMDDLSEEKKFITRFTPGQVSAPIETKDGYEVFKLVDKRDPRVKTFEERYQEISNLLKRPLYERLFSEYKQELFERATIVYF